MKVTIDRFEGEFAVCEQADRTMVNILKDNIPQEAKEGDILIIEGDSISIDVEGTAERKKRINRLMDDLWK
ncbi:MAG TPA: DUF3006 domain-containing protein [Dehalococcoidia bacterium]|nr:DUF3006 domain-containing protein [Dehalococcoidia bacterium]